MNEQYKDVNSDFWKKDIQITRNKLKKMGSKLRPLAESKILLQQYLDNKYKKTV